MMLICPLLNCIVHVVLASILSLLRGTPLFANRHEAYIHRVGAQALEDFTFRDATDNRRGVPHQEYDFLHLDL
jgi:hypothetical protein